MPVKCYRAKGRLRGPNGKYIKKSACSEVTSKAKATGKSTTTRRKKPAASKAKTVSVRVSTAPKRKAVASKAKASAVVRKQAPGMPKGYWLDAAGRLRAPSGYLTKNPLAEGGASTATKKKVGRPKKAASAAAAAGVSFKIKEPKRSLFDFAALRAEQEAEGKRVVGRDYSKEEEWEVTGAGTRSSSSSSSKPRSRGRVVFDESKYNATNSQWGEDAAGDYVLHTVDGTFTFDGETKNIGYPNTNPWAAKLAKSKRPARMASPVSAFFEDDNDDDDEDRKSVV